MSDNTVVDDSTDQEFSQYEFAVSMAWQTFQSANDALRGAKNRKEIAEFSVADTIAYAQLISSIMNTGVCSENLGLIELAVSDLSSAKDAE
jgi:hypothetical protein